MEKDSRSVFSTFQADPWVSDRDATQREPRRLRFDECVLPGEREPAHRLIAAEVGMSVARCEAMRKLGCFGGRPRRDAPRLTTGAGLPARQLQAACRTPIPR